MEDRITLMIPRYGKLNKIYTEIMSGGSFSFAQQQFISDFYREYGDTQTFETALISLMLEMDGTQRLQGDEALHRHSRRHQG